MKIKLFSFLMFVAMIQPVSGSPLPDYPFVFAEGVAESQVAPDIAFVSLNVKARSENSDAALAVLTKRTEEVLQLLADHKIAVSDIEAHTISKSALTADYDSPGKKTVILGYELSRTFEVTIRDVAKWADIAPAILQKANIDNLEVRFDTTKRKQLEAELVAKAAQDARQKAVKMAEGFGVTLGDVAAISVDSLAELPLRFGFGAMGYGGAQAFMMAAPPSRELSVPATIDVYQKLNAVFRLK
jgi:uncharacterized protein YggE